MGDKCGIVVVNGGRGIEKHRPQVLLDVADFGGVFPHTVHDKLNVAAVQLHKLALYKLCRVVVPGDTDFLSCGADGFKDNVNDFVKTFPVCAAALHENVIVDIVLDDFLIHPVCVARFLSLPFRLCRVPAIRQGVRGMDRNGMGN